jgi:prevent-host-death family protein
MAPGGWLGLSGVRIVTRHRHRHSVRAADAGLRCDEALHSHTPTAAGLDATPIIIPVSELRRDIARLIEKAHRSPDPLFITQRGYVTAVLLTPQKYEDLRDAGRAEQERGASSRRLNDRRIQGRQYGPWDWETARLMNDGEYEEYEE